MTVGSAANAGSDSVASLLSFLQKPEARSPVLALHAKGSVANRADSSVANLLSFSRKPGAQSLMHLSPLKLLSSPCSAQGSAVSLHSSRGAAPTTGS